jgi:invasion protein IalB
MGRMASRLLCVIALADLVAAPAAAEGARAPELIYSPWTKICIGETCLVGASITTECGFVATAVLSEKAGEAKKTLRVTLPPRVNLERGVRITVDQRQPAELVDWLKQGQTLFLEGVDAANSPINQSLPLRGFAEAYDGPLVEPRVLEELKLSQKERERK